ncbi:MULTISPECIES: hypothetical protein [unclassified Curtobacterium]|uniref:hypothetical protein n=1 Tax=unclassified Curtobacterium TaxID=257496 RepID=UPI0015641D06|nr:MULTISPECIES: hypothetical protein [unclassified Curtobacterium]NQX22941.1 hypothetical protein [Curtobacterium sp. VKM Ac-2852]
MQPAFAILALVVGASVIALTLIALSTPLPIALLGPLLAAVGLSSLVRRDRNGPDD